MTKDEVTRTLALLSRRAAMWTDELIRIDELPLTAKFPDHRLQRIHDDLASALSTITLSVKAG